MERAFFGALDVVLSKLCYFLRKLCYSKCFSLCSFAEFNDRIMVTRIKTISAIIFSLVSALCANAQMPDFSGSISLKTPGNPAETFSLDGPLSGELSAAADLPLSITRKIYEKDDAVVVELTITATDLIYYNIGQSLHTGFGYGDCLFYMPGFWYRDNMRSPASAPSFRTSDSWAVREDRLSAPLTGIYDKATGEYCTVLRIEESGCDAQPCHTAGEVILSGETSVGYTGFNDNGGKADIVFGFPYREEPKSYIRKLTLAPDVCSFSRLDAGESHNVVWEIRKGRSASWSDFIADVWEYSYDRLVPDPVEAVHTPEEAKAILSEYFTQSYVGSHPLKYYSGVGLRTADCKPNGKAEVGFIGRVLLNAFNALEYGYEQSRKDLVAQAESVFSSYLENGFTSGGLFREDVDFGKDPDGAESGIYSIRRQSEGVCAVLTYLDYEKNAGRRHPEWESRIRTVLDRFLLLQGEDGSFPRKFSDALDVKDPSGGSTSSAVLPLAMGYRYFRDRDYLAAAELAAGYLEKELIAKADYFSSTLDANCEDKEASLYTSTAMYYMCLVEKNKAMQKHYADLCLESAFFALSWYYLWDVPFAQGQMLGDVGFRSRGWGNVSVENNHIDVFIFEFADVLDFLAEKYDEPRFSSFTEVIRTSMLQLLPEAGSMYDIAKEGYCPEVVQHTAWDYGKNGKGFYNDIFAPGWTVASLWQMLTPGRAENYFKNQR